MTNLQYVSIKKKHLHFKTIPYGQHNKTFLKLFLFKHQGAPALCGKPFYEPCSKLREQRKRFATLSEADHVSSEINVKPRTIIFLISVQ